MFNELQGTSSEKIQSFRNGHPEDFQILKRELLITVSDRDLENGTGRALSLGFQTEAGVRSFVDLLSDATPEATSMRAKFSAGFLDKLNNLPKVLTANGVTRQLIHTSTTTP